MTKAKALIVPVTPFQQNCTLLWCEVTKRAVVIDPGGDLPEVERAITRAGVSVDKIWLTHGHVDHVAGATDLKTNLKVSIEGPHKDDLFLLQHVAETGRSYGMWNASNVTPDRWLEEGDQVQIGELTFDVLHCPGHSPGSIIYFNPVQRLAMVGDVLFGKGDKSQIPDNVDISFRCIQRNQLGAFAHPVGCGIHTGGLAPNVVDRCEAIK